MQQNKKNNPLLIIIIVGVLLYFTQSTWMSVIAKTGILNSLPKIELPIVSQNQNQRQPEPQQPYNNQQERVWSADPYDSNIHAQMAANRCITLDSKWHDAHPQAGSYESFLKDNPQCNQP